MINFWADAYDIESGKCTVLRWELTNESAAYLSGSELAGQPVKGFSGTQDACPKENAVYTLQVKFLDGSQDLRSVTISVMPPPQTPIPDTPTPVPPSLHADAVADTPSSPTPGLG